MTKYLWLLRLIRVIVNQICGSAYDNAQTSTNPVSAADLRHVHIAARIRDILIEHNINEN